MIINVLLFIIKLIDKILDTSNILHIFVPVIKNKTMKTETPNMRIYKRPLLIDYILSFQGENGYPEHILRSLPDENIIATAERIYAERQLEKSKSKIGKI